MTGYTVALMAFCLGLTIIIETCLACFLGMHEGKDLLIVIIANCITNPAASSVPAVLAFFFGRSIYVFMLIIIETAVLFAEWIIFKSFLRYRRIRPFALSLILNAASFITGKIVFLFFE